MAKKRANGEGSIRKKPSGRWEGRYTQGIDPVTGKAIQKSVSAKTQAECKEKLAKAIRENRGVPLNHTGDYTAAEWCRLWFETYSKPNIRYNTAVIGATQPFSAPWDSIFSNSARRPLSMSVAPFKVIDQFSCSILPERQPERIIGTHMTCAELADIVFHQFTGFRFKYKNAVIPAFHRDRHSVCE